MSDNYKNDYFDSDFYISFLEGMDHHNRYAVTVIDSICKEVINNTDRTNSPKFIQECMNKITYQCSQIMKLSEVYTAVTNLISNNGIENGSINAGKFISDHIKKCTEYLKNDVCRLNLTNSLKDSDVCISFDNIFVDKRILEFVITICLRKMIINGAREININVSGTNEEIAISLKTVKSESPVPEEIMPELISVKLCDDIIKASADKLNSKFEIGADSAELRIPVSPKNVLGQPIKDERGYFNLYNNLLSDLETIISYTKDIKK